MVRLFRGGLDAVDDLQRIFSGGVAASGCGGQSECEDAGWDGRFGHGFVLLGCRFTAVSGRVGGQVRRCEARSQVLPEGTGFALNFDSRSQLRVVSGRRPVPQVGVLLSVFWL